MAGRCAGSNKRAALLTNRRILLQQAAGQLAADGIDFGVISAEWGEYFDPLAPVQLCSIPTLWARRERVQLPPADLVIIDEAHSNCKGEMARGLIEHYKRAGAIIAGFTATPVGLGHVYDSLVVAASNSELINKGILVPCSVYAPSEPDLSGVRVTSGGEYHSGDLEKRVRSCTVFGHIYPHWHELNPEHKPTVIWAPGRDFSRYFVQMFREKGVTAEHVDGDTTDEERADIFGRLADGKLTMVSSCGVLKEGWNAPNVSVGVLLQPCRNLETYIQLAGRILRSHNGKDEALLIDHAGAVWRHGSPTDDREWKITDTAAGLRAAAKAPKKPGASLEDGILCPQCKFCRPAGKKCPKCGFEYGDKVRFVREIDGRLTRRVLPDAAMASALRAQREWDKCFWRCVKSKRRLVMRQVYGMYQAVTGQKPPTGLLRMPAAGSADWARPVKELANEWRNNK